MGEAINAWITGQGNGPNCDMFRTVGLSSLCWTDHAREVVMTDTCVIIVWRL